MSHISRRPGAAAHGQSAGYAGALPWTRRQEIPRSGGGIAARGGWCEGPPTNGRALHQTVLHGPSFLVKRGVAGVVRAARKSGRESGRGSSSLGGASLKIVVGGAERRSGQLGRWCTEFSLSRGEKEGKATPPRLMVITRRGVVRTEAGGPSLLQRRPPWLAVVLAFGLRRNHYTPHGRLCGENLSFEVHEGGVIR